MGLAIIHVLGAIVASIGIGIVLIVIGAWEQERVQRRRLQGAALALGVPMSSLEADESLVPRLIEYSAQRVSSDLLRNRLSDLCGAIRTAWGWLSVIGQVGVFLGVAWAMYYGGPGNAVYMWLVLVVSILCWLLSVAFSFACLLLTGRYPGEAKATRKALADFIEQRRAAVVDPHERQGWES